MFEVKHFSDMTGLCITSLPRLARPDHRIVRPMTNLDELSEIAERQGIVIPASLRNLISMGLTIYPENYRSDFLEISTLKPPAFSCAFDFEWLSDGEAFEIYNEWLSPKHQDSNVFLPFAKSGAGDCYSLVRHHNSYGCGVIWHDSTTSDITLPSFESFACQLFLDALQDLSHLIDDGFSLEQATRCVRTDIAQVSSALEGVDISEIQMVIQREPAFRPYKAAPKAREQQVFSFISQDEHAKLASLYRLEFPFSVPVAARWDIS